MINFAFFVFAMAALILAAEEAVARRKAARRRAASLLPIETPVPPTDFREVDVVARSELGFATRTEQIQRHYEQNLAISRGVEVEQLLFRLAQVGSEPTSDPEYVQWRSRSVVRPPQTLN